MDPEHFGFFEFEPEPQLEYAARWAPCLEAAAAVSERVDAVILPEGAAPTRSDTRSRAHPGATRRDVPRHRCRDSTPTRVTFGRNYLHFGVATSTGWKRYEQDKHHRWCLDDRQIRQYHLTRSLEPKRLWWEAIDISERTLHVIDVGGGITTVPLVCEDLARLDEVADLIRRIGPNLVVALLLDGPQLRSQVARPLWQCHRGRSGLRSADAHVARNGSALPTARDAPLAGHCALEQPNGRCARDRARAQSDSGADHRTHREHDPLDGGWSMPPRRPTAETCWSTSAAG